MSEAHDLEATNGRALQEEFVPKLGWLILVDALSLSCFLTVSLLNAYRRPASERPMHLTTAFLMLAALGVTGGLFWLVTHPPTH